MKSNATKTTASLPPKKVAAKDQSGMVFVKNEAVHQATEVEAKAFCEDRKFLLVRPMVPPPPVWIKHASQITQSEKTPYLFFIPPHRTMHDEKVEERVAPFGDPAKLIRVVEPFFKNQPQGAVGGAGYTLALRNYNGKNHEHLNTATKEWTVEDGDSPSELLQQGLSRYPGYLMPKDACRFFLRIEKLRVARLFDLTSDEKRATGWWVPQDKAKTTNLQQQFEAYWRNYYDKPYVVGTTSYEAAPWESNPFVWVAEVWPVHLEKPQPVKPPLPTQRPLAPGTWSPRKARYGII